MAAIKGFFCDTWLGASLVVALCSFAVAFILVWFPFGFIMGDLTINPMDWSLIRREVLIVLWLVSLVAVGLSAAN